MGFFWSNAKESRAGVYAWGIKGGWSHPYAVRLAKGEVDGGGGVIVGGVVGLFYHSWGWGGFWWVEWAGECVWLWGSLGVDCGGWPWSWGWVGSGGGDVAGGVC